MKAKNKRSTWVSEVAVAFLMITLTSSCYLKNNNEPTFQYYNQGEKSSSFTKKEMSKFSSSVRNVDGQAESHYKMALHFQRNRRHKLAIEELNKAIQEDPAMAKAYNAMGVSFDKLRKNSQAIHCYQLALKMNSNLDYVHNNLGYSYLHIGNLDAAILSIQKAIQLDDENKRYRNNLALAYVMTNRYDLAIDQLKDFEGGLHASETVAELAHRLGKKDFEKKLVSALQRMGSEKILVAEAKPVSSKPAVLGEEVNEKKYEFVSEKPLFVGRKIECLAPVLTSGKGLSKGKKIQTRSTAVSESQNKQLNATTIENFPKPLGRSSESRDARFADIDEAGIESELVATDDPVKKDAIVSPTVVGKSFYAQKHIRVRWEDCVDGLQTLSNVAYVEPAGDIQHLKDGVLNHKQTIWNEGNLQKPEKEFDNYLDESLHLSAFEMVFQPPTEKPHFISRGLQESDATTSIKAIKKETAQRQRPIIKPKVIDVADVSKPAEKEPENTMIVKSAGKLEIVPLSDWGSTTREISPVYETSTLPSEKTGRKGPSIIVVSPSPMDKKIQNTAALIEELKTKQRGQDIVELEIANGNGVNGMAGRLQYFLKERGFKVVKITNARTFEHITTKIFYNSGHRKDVDRLIQEIAFCPDERSIIELKKSGRRIKILIGKDIMKPNQVLATAKFTRKKP